MKDSIKEPDEIEEEELEDDEENDDAEEGEEVVTEASYEELFVKRAEADDEDDDPIIDMTREERIESLSIRTVPRQANEFVCANCHLVKHNSQLADAKAILCRDCV